jgi:hypothetical protein
VPDGFQSQNYREIAAPAARYRLPAVLFQPRPRASGAGGSPTATTSVIIIGPSRRGATRPLAALAQPGERMRRMGRTRFALRKPPTKGFR